MTHTDSTAAGLLRGVLLNPENDTARLVYADRLEEIAGTVPCPTCKGGGKEPAPPLINATDGKTYRYIEPLGPCPTCKGGGTVSDGLAERAELIRVQCSHLPAAERAYDDCLMRDLHYTDPEKANASAELKRIRARERDLLTDACRRGWFGVPCPECGGTGHDRGDVYDRGMVGVCRACTGTCLAPVEVRRGFVESVRCRMRDVLEAGRFLSQWAAGVLKTHPVTRWEILDRELEAINASGYAFRQTALPPKVFLELEGHPHCPTPEAARLLLALAVGRVARRLAGLSE